MLVAAPPSRVRVLRDAPPRRTATYVLYWMIAARRLEDNFGLQQAAWWAKELDLPLLIFEPLRVGYQWASDRLHTFVMQGMAALRADSLVPTETNQTLKETGEIFRTPASDPRTVTTDHARGA